MNSFKKDTIKLFNSFSDAGIFEIDSLKWDNIDFDLLFHEMVLDFRRYYSSPMEVKKFIYFRGLIATFSYRISRQFFLKN